jgi:hypothetical protein
MQNSKSLSARLLKALYFPDKHLLDAALGSDPHKFGELYLMDGTFFSKV